MTTITKEEKLEKMMAALSIGEETMYPACVIGASETERTGVARLGMTPAPDMLPDTPFPYHVFTPDQAAEASELTFGIMGGMSLLVAVPVPTPTLAMLLTGVPSEMTVASAKLAALAAREGFLQRKSELSDPEEVLQDERGATLFMAFFRERICIINAQNALERYKPSTWPAVVDTLKLFHFYMRTIKLAEIGRPQRAEEFFKATRRLEQEWARLFTTVCVNHRLEAALNELKRQIVFTGLVHDWRSPALTEAMAGDHLREACREFSVGAVAALERWIMTCFEYPAELHETLSVSKRPRAEFSDLREPDAEMFKAAVMMEACRRRDDPEYWPASELASGVLLHPEAPFREAREQRLMTALARLTLSESDMMEATRRAQAALVCAMEPDMYDSSAQAEVALVEAWNTPRVPLFAKELTPTILGDSRFV